MLLARGGGRRSCARSTSTREPPLSALRGGRSAGALPRFAPHAHRRGRALPVRRRRRGRPDRRLDRAEVPFERIVEAERSSLPPPRRRPRWRRPLVFVPIQCTSTEGGTLMNGSCRQTTAALLPVLVVSVLLAALCHPPPLPRRRPSSQAALGGTWSGTYSGSYRGTFTIRWRQAQLRCSHGQDHPLASARDVSASSGKVQRLRHHVRGRRRRCATYNGSVSGSNRCPAATRLATAGAATGARTRRPEDVLRQQEANPGSYARGRGFVQASKWS